jgi:hypothetical protein
VGGAGVLAPHSPPPHDPHGNYLNSEIVALH